MLGKDVQFFLYKQHLMYTKCILVQLDHYNRHELGWNIRMMYIGFINDVGLGVILAFLSQLSDLNLLDIKEKFVENGWETFGDFGFGCSCQTDTKSGKGSYGTILR